MQLTSTALDRAAWPLSPYNMFNFHLRDEMVVIKVALIQDDGVTQMVSPGAVLPLEFFRSVSIVYDIFVDGNDLRRKQKLAEFILRRLQARPWSNWDERQASPRPAPGRRFISLRIVQGTERYTRLPQNRPTAFQLDHVLFDSGHSFEQPRP